MATCRRFDEMDFRFLSENFEDERAKDDGVHTNTYWEQDTVEESIHECFKAFKNKLELNDGLPVLNRDRHKAFLIKGLQHLSESYEVLDASRPWLCYWILHSMELMNIDITEKQASQVIQFLARCQCPEGGFAGGPGQLAHLAPTYAAVNALCILGTVTDQAYKCINREKLLKYLMSMRTPEGSFIMHEGGEEDIRGAYCALSAAKLSNIFTPALYEGTAEWIVRCQTYEGGFGGVPGMEAHGGYSFCGLAALVLMGREWLCDMDALLRWTCNRQMRYEGGFQGRTNKLVDGCYSFWQGGAFPLIHAILTEKCDQELSAENWMFNQNALQEYLLICCQHPSGGLIDKPGKPRDFYHTCYCLSGLSVSQHFSSGKLEHVKILGNPSNELRTTHPLFNICGEAVLSSSQFFSSEPSIDLNSQS